MLDTMASRYHRLPSELIATADTFDLLVMDTAIQWTNAQHKKAEAEATGNKYSPDNIPQDALKSMIDRVKKKHQG